MNIVTIADLVAMIMFMTVCVINIILSIKQTTAANRQTVESFNNFLKLYIKVRKCVKTEKEEKFSQKVFFDQQILEYLIRDAEIIKDIKKFYSFIIFN